MSEYLPEPYLAFRDRFPAVAEATDAVGRSLQDAGPLDERTQRLVKLGIAVGAEAEGAVRSNVRKALDVGVTVEELRHAAVLAVTTAGFPTAIAGLAWVDQVIEAQRTTTSEG
ncbi:MAG: carboxymuconolactone decarboxylase family protein [Nitriliruptoraceae bacterium]